MIGSYLNWAAVLFNLKVDEPRTFEIQRGNETLILSVVPKQRWFLGYEGPSLLGHVLWRIGQLVMLGLACFLASARPRDRSALIVSLFFAGLSLSNVPETMTGVNAMLRQLPTVLLALFYISWVARGLTAPLFFTFCATFPRPLLRSRRLWMLIWMPYLLMLALVAVLFNPVIFDSHHAIGTFSIALYNGLNVSSVLYFVAGMIAVVANYRRLTDVNERRRIRVVVFGSVVGLLALLAFTPYYFLFRQPGFRR